MNDLMLQVLVVAIAANVVLIVVAVIRSRMLRSRRDLATTSATMASSEGLVPPVARSPGAIPADMTSTEPTATEPTKTGEEPAMTANADQPMRPRRFTMPEDEDYPSDESVDAFLSSGPREGAPAKDLFDPETGLRTGLAWDEALGQEDARRARYGRPVTVVVAELDRLDALARQLGRENADRLIRPVAQALLVNARAADVVARLGHHRFGILLPETDEIRAINYVERVRLACDAWLDAAAVSVRLSIGWASSPTGGDLTDAFAVAERRMYADRSGGTRPPTRQGAPAEDVAPPDASPPSAAEPVRSDDASGSYAGWSDRSPELGAG